MTIGFLRATFHNHVVPAPGIFIGGLGAAQNFMGLNEHGMKSVLDVAVRKGTLHALPKHALYNVN